LWPFSWREKAFMKNMSLLELIPIVMALYIWVEEFA
jgi:hypothetical protein